LAKKLALLSKTKVMIKFLLNLGFFLVKNDNCTFWQKYFKSHNIGPWSLTFLRYWLPKRQFYSTFSSSSVSDDTHIYYVTMRLAVICILLCLGLAVQGRPQVTPAQPGLANPVQTPGLANPANTPQIVRVDSPESAESLERPAEGVPQVLPTCTRVARFVFLQYTKMYQMTNN
jgi:hypothetical protein